jgi:DNA polymerase-3 subunit delta
MTDGISPAYLIVGDDTFLVEESRNEIVSKVGEISVDEFGPDDDPREILQALGTAPMFAERRVVVVTDLSAMSAEAHREITAYLEDPNPSVVLILISEKQVSKVGAAVRKIGRQIDASRGRRNELIAWVREHAKTKGLKVSGESAAALIDAVGEDRMAVAQALEEMALANPGGSVAPSQVERQFQGRADAKIFGFVDAVASRQPGTALDFLHRLFQQGEAPQSLFWMLTRHFRMLLAALDLRPPQIEEMLGLPRWRAEKLARQAKGFSKEELSEAYQLLGDADRKMKRSEEPEELTLERIVVEIAGDRQPAVKSS